jgi:uncharacterized protein YjbI with pentapeptide repeats
MREAATVVTAVAALLVTAWSLHYTAESNRATADQLDLSRRQQVADRFGRAIDQLGQEGTDKLGIRLGGVYALETLMHDSDDDAPTVIEVLCAFVRTHTPVPRRLPANQSAPTADIMAAITVLGRRPDPSRPRHMLDLHQSYLVRADLHGVSFSGSDLNNAYLSRSNLFEADLEGAELNGADMSHSNMAGANLTRAELSSAQMQGAYVGDAYLNETNLIHADLSGAFLARSELIGANLRSVDLSHADLNHADLTYADLAGANLTGADLRGANLSGAHLLGTDFGDAQLAGAQLPDTMSSPGTTPRSSPS